MSVASSGKSDTHNQAASRAASQQQQQQQNQQQAAAFNKASTPTGNIGTGYGGGRITYDKSGNKLQDGKIVQFAGRQAQESYLAERGYGNNGIILDQSKAAKADFSNLQQPNISGVVNAEQPPGGFGWNWGGQKTGTTQLVRGSQFEQTIQQQEAARAAQIYPNYSNPDFATGGKKASDKTVVSLGKAESFFGKTSDKQYGWHDIGKDQLVRNSKQEEQVKQSEAAKAFINPKSNSDYITGGTPSKEAGGVITSKSSGKNAGWNVLAPDQISRNSPKEEAVKQNEAQKATAFTSPKNNKEYDAFTSTPEGKSAMLEYAKTNSQNNLIGFDNSLIAYQNAKARANNLKSEKEFQSYLGQGEKQGATFLFFSGNKQVGQSSGARTYYDFLKAQKTYGPNLSIETVYPQREKTLTEAVSKNTAFYSSLPQSYWDALSKAGYFSERNQGKINEQINLYGKIQNRESQANLQSFSANIIGNKPHGESITLGYQQLKNVYSAGKTEFNPLTDIIIGAEKGSKSLVDTGKATYDYIKSYGKTNNFSKIEPDIISQILSSPLKTVTDQSGKQKTTISGTNVQENLGNVKQAFVNDPYREIGKSISANSILFLPIGEFASATKTGIDILLRSEPIIELGTKAGEIKTGIANRARTTIGSKVFEESLNAERKPISFEPRTVREQGTFRSTNPMRTSLASDILSKDITEARTPVSARPNTPRNTLFEDITKQTQTSLSKSQSDLLTPKTPTSQPSASPNLPFFKGRLNQFGRLFSANQPPLNEISKPVPNEAANVFGKASGQPPISTRTEPNTGLSPISRQYFGVQFKGSYPQNYVPSAAGQIGGKTVKPIESDIFYTPARKPRNIELEFGVSPKESVSASPDFLGVRKNLVKENQSIFLSKTQSNLLAPTKKQTIKIIEEKPPEETNPLGRKGKPPIQNKNPLDITQTPRSEFVERGRIKPEQEVFTSRGQKLRNEYGDIFYGELSKPQGALRATSKSQKATKPIVDLEPQKEYQQWRFEKNAAKGPFNYGFRTGKAPKEVNLPERKDYQDWRFAKYLEKNPQPEKVGSARFQEFVEKKLPKVNKKAPVYSSIFKETKGKKFKSTSVNLFETKKPETKTGTEFKNVGSKQETVLLQKPQVRRRIIIEQKQEYDYGYEYKPVPSSKTETGLVSGIMSGLKSGTLPISKTGSKLGTSSLLGNLNKNLTGILPKSGYRQSPKQTGKLFINQTEKQTPKQVPRILQTPKQGTTPKQGQKPMPKMLTPQQPKQTPIPKQTPYPRFNTPLIPPKPPKLPPPVPLLFGPVSKRGKGKNKEGPTALLNLDVTNVFASGFNITTSRNKRVEF